MIRPTAGEAPAGLQGDIGEQVVAGDVVDLEQVATVPPSAAPARAASTDLVLHDMLKPMEIKKLARVPYATVIQWLTVGHPRAGILPSVDLAATRKRHSYRIRRQDWEAFLARLQTSPREQQRAKPMPRPSTTRSAKRGMFSY
jgi:hypothetical protein